MNDSEENIYDAIRCSNHEKIKEFLKDKSKLNQIGKLGVTPLIFAVDIGNYEVVETLLCLSPKLEIKDGLYPGRRTAFYHAVVENNSNIVKILHKFGAKVDVKDYDGYTPLLEAIGLKNSDMVQLLLDLGANPNLSTKMGIPLNHATLIRENKVIDLLINYGANISGKDNTGMTPLMNAAFDGNYDLVERFIAMGSELDAQDCDGNTALMHSIVSFNPNLVKLLLESGVNTSLKNEKGETALEVSRRFNADKGLAIQNLISCYSK